MVLLCRYPVFIKRYQLAHTLYEYFFRYHRHIHSFGRLIEPSEIILRPKYKSIIMFILIRFNAFKNGLAIMKGSQ